ncbi:hypothetical protein Tco_0360577 [Tanacetum coccineum]
MIKEGVDVAISAEWKRQAKVRNDASGSGPVRGQVTEPAVRECTFVGFMKCNPTVFRGVEGAVELRRWFEKTKSVFGISECAECKKVRFAATILEGPTLTWWNSKIQRMEHELWNLKVKEYDIVAYTQRFEDAVEPEIETVPVSVYEVGESSTAAIPREDGDSLLPGFMRRDIDSLFVRSSVEQGTAAMEKLVERLGDTEDKVEYKKLKKELEEARLSNTFLRMQNERVERDLYWTRVRAHEFYQEMIRRGFVFEERRMKLSMFQLRMRRFHL